MRTKFASSGISALIPPPAAGAAAAAPFLSATWATGAFSAVAPLAASALFTMVVIQLMLEVDHLLEDFVAGRDDARVGLEAALRGDQIGEFARQIDIGQCQLAGDQRAGPIAAGNTRRGQRAGF